MTKLNLIALLICLIVSPAFGQIGGGKIFTFLNDTNLQMQIRFKSPQGSFYDKVQSLSNGRLEEFNILPGWRAIAEYPGMPHYPVELVVNDGASFHANFRGNQPHIASRSVMPGPDEDAAPIGGGKRLEIRNESNLRLQLQIDGPGGETGKQLYVAAGRTKKVRVLPGWSIAGVLDNGIKLHIIDPQDLQTYRFYSRGNSYHMERIHSTPESPRPNPVHSLEQKIAQAFGVTIRSVGANQVQVVQVSRGSIANELRIQRGDTIMDVQMVSALDQWGQPQGGFQLNGFTIMTARGYRMTVDLQASGMPVMIP